MKPNKEIINVAIRNYGHLIERGIAIDNYKFSSLIEDNYSVCNPLTQQVWRTVRDNVDLRYKRELSGFVRVLIIH